MTSARLRSSNGGCGGRRPTTELSTRDGTRERSASASMAGVRRGEGQEERKAEKHVIARKEKLRDRERERERDLQK